MWAGLDSYPEEFEGLYKLEGWTFSVLWGGIGILYKKWRKEKPVAFHRRSRSGIHHLFIKQKVFNFENVIF